ncbi:pirin family protein [Pleurocapsales cyanobacterium LEGE 06147]|nr:pirin family protein [Pleurocapsales cyanobacterium LEGE 06147]
MSKAEITNPIHDRHARGHTKTGWLDSYHTFSFGGFYDPNRMGFRSLRVINDDRVVPGAGFSSHSHRDMEIITYVLDGALEHKDSLGNGAVIYPGDAQIMSAGTGITHSEFNPSSTEPVHFLQIWIIPNRQDLQPRYEQKHFPLETRRGKLQLIVDPQGREGAVTIHQDVQIYAAILDVGETITYDLECERYGWLQVARGTVQLNGEELREGDGVQMLGGQHLDISTLNSAELLLFDLA